MRALINTASIERLHATFRKPLIIDAQQLRFGIFESLSVRPRNSQLSLSVGWGKFIKICREHSVVDTSYRAPSSDDALARL
jgi:hypothetical protein